MKVIFFLADTELRSLHICVVIEALYLIGADDVRVIIAFIFMKTKP